MVKAVKKEDRSQQSKKIFVEKKTLEVAVGFEKWCTIRINVGSVGGALVWVAWMACLLGWSASIGGVLVWVACQRGWCGWSDSVGDVGGVPVWVR